MGNLCSKCFGKEDKYKEDRRKKENGYKLKTVDPVQAEQEETTVKVTTNKGDTHEQEANMPNKVPIKTNNRAVPKVKEPEPEKPRAGNPHDKRRKKKYQSDSEEGTDTSSSSSSSSSSESDDGGYSRSNRKVYKNKRGGTTIVSNKTIVGGNYMAIGKNAKNVVVTINKDSSGSGRKNKNRTSKKSAESPAAADKPSEGPCKELFKSYYTTETAKVEEKKLFASPIGSTTRLPGNFIQLQEQTFSALDLKALGIWSDSICQIVFPNGCGTGFRVGQNEESGPFYIMTAKHVVDAILKQDYQFVGRKQTKFQPLGRETVYAIFNFLMDNQQIEERSKFYFKACVHFMDDKTDCAILELKPNDRGTVMPRPFKYFSVKLDSGFHFIGHPDGGKKLDNPVHHILDKTSQQTKEDISEVKAWSRETYSRNYESPPHSVLTNEDRILFHCTFTKGASGSPGIVVLPDTRVVVVTMLLCGYPDWYYDTNVNAGERAEVSAVYRIEQGVNMLGIYNKMKNDPIISQSRLCAEIFG